MAERPKLCVVAGGEASVDCFNAPFGVGLAPQVLVSIKVPLSRGVVRRA
jgi:hypothetical protein